MIGMAGSLNARKTEPSRWSPGCCWRRSDCLVVYTAPGRDLLSRPQPARFAAEAVAPGGLASCGACRRAPSDDRRAERPSVADVLHAAVEQSGRRGPARASSRWRARSSTRWSPASTCSSRRAPEPASRWATWCRRCCTTIGSWSPRPRWRCSTSWSSATSRRCSTPRRDVLGSRPSYAVLKGRSNYACLHRIRDGVPDDQGALIDLPEGSMGAEVAPAAAVGRGGVRGRRARRPRQRAVAHRSALEPGVGQPPRVPRGRPSARTRVECFAERAREQAMQSSLIVTNHSLLAIDAIEGVPMIPEYDVVVVDEAHELAVPGDPGRHRRAVAAGDRARVAPGPQLRRRRRGRRPRRCGRCAAGRDGRRRARPDRRTAGVAGAPRSTWCAAPPVRRSRRSRRSRPRPRPTPPGSRRAAWSTRSARSPSGWPPTTRPT